MSTGSRARRAFLTRFSIGARLAAVFVLCGLLIGCALVLDTRAQRRDDARQAELEELAAAQQVADDLLVFINDITGWQALYLLDTVVLGVEDGLAADAYNIEGYTESQERIEAYFAGADRSVLSDEEAAVFAAAEEEFDGFFAADLVLRETLRDRGLDALPDVMDSINGGPAGIAWSAVYNASEEYRALVEDRAAQVRADAETQQQADRRLVYVALGLALALMIVLLVVVTRSLTRSLRGMVSTLQQVATGRLDVRATVEGEDEIAQMAQALNDTLAAIGGAMGGLAAQVESMSRSPGELTSVAERMSATASESASATPTRRPRSRRRP
jgi:methyl-accepting chemotaxis protein